MNHSYYNTSGLPGFKLPTLYHCAKGVRFRKFHTHGNGCSICTQSFPLAVYEHRNGYRKRKDQFPEFQASIYVTRKLHVWKLHMWKRADDLLETG